MLFYLVFLFIAIPVIELALLLEIGRLIGAPATILVVVLTGAVGAALARSQGFKIIGKIKHNMRRGIMPGRDMLEGALILTGGITLLTPGFITDMAGFAALIPITRRLIIKYIRNKIKAKIESGGVRIVDAEGYEVEEEMFISGDKKEK